MTISRNFLLLIVFLFSFGGQDVFSQYRSDVKLFLSAESQNINSSISSNARAGDLTSPEEVMTVTCGMDTVRYPLAKATGAVPFQIGIANTQSGIGQFYPAPQNLTIHGVEFYGFVDSATNQTVDIDVSIFAAMPGDSLPDNLSLLGSTTFTLDSNLYGGNLTLLRKCANFSPPINVNQDYVVVITNHNQIPVGIAANDPAANDGGGEWLGCYEQGAIAWFDLQSSNVDMDWLLHPKVTYDLSSGFTSSATNACQNVPFTFTNNLTSPIINSPFYNLNVFQGNMTSHYSWDYGDGSPVEQQQDGAHSYGTDGTYDVTLTDSIVTWSSGVCEDISTQTITINPGAAVVSSFNWTLSGGTVDFNDNATGLPTTWAWDFDDGNTSATISPNHSFVASGTYNVCLTVENACGADTYCEDVIITCPPPVSDFSFAYTAMDFNFVDETGGTPAAWQWNFGDGSFSNLQNPSHSFAQDGYYNVCLASTDSCGTNSYCEVLTIGCPAPLVNFAFNSVGLTYSFQNYTFGQVTTYTWDFGDGTQSGQQGPTHTFPAPGLYNVCLYAQNDCGLDSLCLSIGVACTTPNAIFVHDDSSLTVQFESGALGNPTNWAWNFGDGTVSTEESPLHVYSVPGLYEVCFTANNPCGSTSQCDTVEVFCVEPKGDFSFTTNHNVVDFDAEPSGFPDNIFWVFGDGGTSTDLNPTHTFAETGTYQVCLVTSNYCGVDSACNFVVVGCVPPVPFFGTGIVDSILTLSDSSTLNTDHWYWDFGDGTTYVGQNPPAHTYSAPGDYLVCLEIDNSCEDTSYCEWITIECTMPTSGFVPLQNGGEILFNDISLIAQSWEYTFGDGYSSQDSSPTHYYSSSGNYTVCQTVTNFCGENTSCQTLLVNCTPPEPIATVVQQDDYVYFINNTAGETDEWMWTFGDGVSSTEENPAHQYTFEGIHDVCFSVTNSCGTSDTCFALLVSEVGIHSDNFPGKLSIYPNPTKGMVYCDIELLKEGNLSLRIVDVLGKEVYSTKITGKSHQEIKLNLVDENPGIYFLILEGENYLHTRKVIRH